MPPKKTIRVTGIPSAERFGVPTIILEEPMPGGGSGGGPTWTAEECFDQAAITLARITPTDEGDTTPTAAETDRFTRISAAWKELGKAMKNG